MTRQHPAATDSDRFGSPEIEVAMGSINMLERRLFGRIIRRRIQSPRYAWVQAVNALGLGGAARAVVAARWSTVTLISGVAALILFSQDSDVTKALGLVSGAVFIVALISYILRIGETIKSVRVRLRRR